MRLNKYVAQASGVSRREADEFIEAGQVRINDHVAKLGEQVADKDKVYLRDELLEPKEYVYLLLNKPIGYVSSRKQQDDKPTIYSLIPEEFHHLKPAGRLDADSRGLMLLTNDGQLAHQMMHPSNSKKKVYHVQLDRELSEDDKLSIENGIEIEDGTSRLKIMRTPTHLIVTMKEGRNRQIRRTFGALGYGVGDLYRTKYGPYSVEDVEEGKTKEATNLV